MSIQIKSLPRKNPRDLEAPEKYYASVVHERFIGIDDLAALISEICTVSEPDCAAVLSSMEKVMMLQLRTGRIVRFGKVGSFRIGISSEGKDTPEEVNAFSVKKSRLIFTPSTRLRDFLRALKFDKVG